MNNTKVVDDFYIFLESIDTPLYDQQFSSYAILNSAGLLEFCSEPLWSSLKNLDF
jgi:hypothetical protein